MLERLRQKIGLVYTRIHFRKHQDKMRQFTNVLSHARNALVILPNDQRDFQLARSILPFLQQQFRRNALTIVLPGQAKDPMRDISPCEIIRLREDDIGKFFIPRKFVVKNIAYRAYDIVMDLNVQFHLPSAFLCKAAGSNVRMGFANEYADTFYNFQVRTATNGNPDLAYEYLVKCLKMF